MINYIQSVYITQDEPRANEYRKKLLEDGYRVATEDTIGTRYEKNSWYRIEEETDEYST